ncbi:MAG: substrate-binding domain-containing protein [Terracidiphilus sp.]
MLELARFPFMMFRRGTWLEGLIDRYFEKYSFQPNIMMRFDSAEAMKATLVSGMGVSILPSYAVAREISSGALRQIRQTQPPLTMDVRILVRNAGFVSPAMRAFISTARENCRACIEVINPVAGENWETCGQHGFMRTWTWNFAARRQNRCFSSLCCSFYSLSAVLRKN